jgi:hypothetical protein
MNILKVLIPVVILKKVYGRKNKGPAPPLTNEEEDFLQDIKDDLS